MKDMHPTAHIVNEKGEIVGFLLHNGTKLNKNTTIVYPVEITEFYRLAKKDRIQFFTVNPETKQIEIKYTEEEKKVLLHNNSQFELYSDDYFKNDPTFNSTYFKANNTCKYSVSVIGAKKMFGCPFIVSYIYKSNPFTDEELNGFKRQNCSITKVSKNMCLMFTPFENLLNLCIQYEMDLNFSVFNNFENVLNKRKIIGFSMCTVEDFKNIQNQLRSYKLGTEWGTL